MGFGTQLRGKALIGWIVRDARRIGKITAHAGREYRVAYLNEPDELLTFSQLESRTVTPAKRAEDKATAGKLETSHSAGGGTTKTAAPTRIPKPQPTTHRIVARLREKRLIGARVCRNLHDGVVTGFSKDGYRVEYDGEEAETLSWKQLETILTAPPQPAQPPPPPSSPPPHPRAPATARSSRPRPPPRSPPRKRHQPPR